MQCEVSLSYVKSVLAEAKGHPTVFADEDSQFNFPLGDGDWYVPTRDTPVKATAPPKTLIRELAKQGDVSAIRHCSSIQKFLTSANVPFGSKPASDAADAIGLGSFKSSVERVSLPILSEDRTEAVLASSGVSGPLAGGGFLHHLRRQPDGQWMVISTSGLWIS